MGITLTLKSDTQIPIEVESINPANLRGLSKKEIARLPIFNGKTQIELGEMFDVAGVEDGNVTFVGDLKSVHWIGAKMNGGQISIEGNVGRHVGSQMTGGSICVNGNAGDFAGCEMRGGAIEINGNAADWLGGGYNGTKSAMGGGSIIVHGSAGNAVGSAMRRGTIFVMGDVGKLTGWNMLAGTIIVGGAAGEQTGTGMVRGTIVLELPLKRDCQLPVTFRRSGIFQPTFLASIFKQHSLEFKPAHNDYELYCGDLLKGGRGEIMTRTRVASD